MGCFDVVKFQCQCTGWVTWQSKAGKCRLDEFTVDEAPAAILIDLANWTESCGRCGKPYRIDLEIRPRIVLSEATSFSWRRGLPRSDGYYWMQHNGEVQMLIEVKAPNIYFVGCDESERIDAERRKYYEDWFHQEVREHTP